MSIFDAPVGEDAWRLAYGDIEAYMEPDADGKMRISPRWRTEKFVVIDLPFTLRIAWDKTKIVARISVHRFAAPAFEWAFRELDKRRLAVFVYEFGGTYADRPVRGGSRLSTHAWGASIDLNPETNPLGMQGDMHPSVVDTFEEAGFTWGGTWSRKDGMHYQFGREY